MIGSRRAKSSVVSVPISRREYNHTNRSRHEVTYISVYVCSVFPFRFHENERSTHARAPAPHTPPHQQIIKLLSTSEHQRWGTSRWFVSFFQSSCCVRFFSPPRKRGHFRRSLPTDRARPGERGLLYIKNGSYVYVSYVYVCSLLREISHTCMLTNFATGTSI